MKGRNELSKNGRRGKQGGSAAQAHSQVGKRRHVLNEDCEACANLVVSQPTQGVSLMDMDTMIMLDERISVLKARTIAVTMRLEKATSFTPPDGVRSAAARGLELRAKWKRGGLTNGEASDQGIGSGVQRAVNLKNGDALDLATVKRMAAFFSRHEKNYRPDEKENDGGPTAGTIAWLLWGGNAGKAWAESIVNRVQKDDGGGAPAAAGGPDAGDVHVPSADWKAAKPKRKKAAKAASPKE